MKAVILAAGKGTRINKDRQVVPKPLYTIGNKCLIEHVINNFKKAGVSDLVIVVGFMAADIINKLGDGSKYGVSITYAVNHEFEKPLGLSVLAAEKYVSGSFLMSMSDHIMDLAGLQKIVEYSLPEDSCALLVDKKIDTIFWLDDAAKVRLEDNLIREVDKKLQDYNAIDCGVFKCTPVIFNEIRKSIDHHDSISAAVTIFSNLDKMFAVDIGEHRWVDVDEYSELEAAREIFKHLTETSERD
jgi:choline kinase